MGAYIRVYMADCKGGGMMAFDGVSFSLGILAGVIIVLVTVVVVFKYMDL